MGLRAGVVALLLALAVVLLPSLALAAGDDGTPTKRSPAARRKAERARAAAAVAHTPLPARPPLRNTFVAASEESEPVSPEAIATVASPPIAPPPTPPPRAEASATFALGLQYRGTVISSALLQAGARVDQSFLLHGAALAAEWRHRSFVVTFGALYIDLATGGFLAGGLGKGPASYVSFLRSDLHAVGPTLDLAWKIELTRGYDLELGASLGALFTFGTLVNNWVYEDEAGQLALGGRTYSACRTANDGPGCRPQDHASPTPVKVGGYVERSWFSGGAAPSVVPWVVLPQLALRARLSESLAAKISVGASAAGVSFGVGVLWEPGG